MAIRTVPTQRKPNWTAQQVIRGNKLTRAIERQAKAEYVRAHELLRQAARRGGC
jgi:hypothetical protein